MSTAGPAGSFLGESIWNMVNSDFLSSYLCRDFPLAPFLIPMLDVAQRCTLKDYSAALREAANCGPELLQTQEKQSWSTGGCWTQQQVSGGGEGAPVQHLG